MGRTPQTARGQGIDVQDLADAYKDEDIDVSEITEKHTDHIFELDMDDVVAIWRATEQERFDTISEGCPHEVNRVGWKRRTKLEFKRGINYLYEVTSGYGERRRRVIGVSIFVVFFFAFLYPLDSIMRVQDGGAQILTYGSVNSFAERLGLFLESFYFSAVKFTTLGYGDLQPVRYSHALSVIESATGALLIALLVFVFRRSVKW